MVKKNELIKFEIREVEFTNKRKSIYEKQVVKFKGGIGGQRVRARISRKRQGHIEVKLWKCLKNPPLKLR